MHDLRDKLKEAGVPEPNRAQRRKALALEKLGPAKPRYSSLDSEGPGSTYAEQEAEERRFAEAEAQRPVERTSKGVRIVRGRRTQAEL